MHLLSTPDLLPELVVWSILGKGTKSSRTHALIVERKILQNVRVTIPKVGWLVWCKGSQSHFLPYSVCGELPGEMFSQGYQYRSLNAYRSVISSVRDKDDGYDLDNSHLCQDSSKGLPTKDPLNHVIHRLRMLA